jgi:hypothetical protein
MHVHIMMQYACTKGIKGVHIFECILVHDIVCMYNCTYDTIMYARVRTFYTRYVKWHTRGEENGEGGGE